MFIVMGQTETRVFEKCPWAMTKVVAADMVRRLNIVHRRAGLPIHFYMTQVLDV